MPGSKKVRYFAFGAMLDSGVLKHRGVIPLEEKFCFLQDYELQFSHPGPWEGMGFASVERAEGKRVYGKLYTKDKINFPSGYTEI